MPIFPKDFLGDLNSAEVAITGAVTLTSTAFGRMHVCSGTSADYTVTLPTAVGNGGKSIGFRMSSALTKKVTLDGNSSELIGAALIREMFKNESCQLLSDNANLVIVQDFRIYHKAKLRRDAAQSIAFDDNVKIAFDAEEYDIGDIGDIATNDRFDIRRAGQYKIEASWGVASIVDAAKRLMVEVNKNGAEVRRNLNMSPAADQTLSVEINATLDCAAGDYIEMYVEQNADGVNAQNTSTLTIFRPTMTVTEQP